MQTVGFAGPNNVRRHTMLFIFLIGTTFGTACAQSAADSVVARKNILKINPLSLFVLHVSAFYERVLTKRASLVGGAGFGSERFEYANNKANVPSPGIFHYERLTLEYRRYYGRRRLAPFGFYGGVYGRVARLTLDDYQFDSQGEFVRDQNGTLVNVNRQLYVWIPGVMVGLQATPRRFAIDLFVGLQYQIPTSSTPLRAVTPLLMSKEGVVPRVGLAVGYRF